MNADLWKNIKGIVFDKDGTLFEFNPVWSEWCDRVIRDLSQGNTSLAAELANKIGYNIDKRVFVSGSLIVSAAAEDTVSALADCLQEKNTQEINAVCLKHLNNLPVVAVNGLTALLAKLKASGIVLGVATNDLEQAAWSQLTGAGIEQYFDFVAGSDSGYGSKPGAGMIHAFCSATKLVSAEVAMVGDSLHDISAGKNAGTAMNIGVLTGPATEQELRPHADIVLQDAAGLSILLDKKR